MSPTYCLCSNLSLARTYKYTYINRYVIYDETYMQIISILSVFNRKVDVSWIAYKSPTEILNWWNFILKEEKVYSGTAETFGKQWQVGDVVGVFLDLIDRTISKTESFKRTLQLPFQAIHIYNLIQEIDYWIQKNVFLNTKVYCRTNNLRSFVFLSYIFRLFSALLYTRYFVQFVWVSFA